MGFLGLWGKKIDSIEHYKQQMKELDKKVISKYHFISNVFFHLFFFFLALVDKAKDSPRSLSSSKNILVDLLHNFSL